MLAVLILGLGVGANTAVFSLFEALMLRSLPVGNPGELAVLGPGALGTMSRSDFPQDTVFSFSQYQALKRDNNDVLATVAAVPTFTTGVYWGDEAPSRGPLPARFVHIGHRLVLSAAAGTPLPRPLA